MDLFISESFTLNIRFVHVYKGYNNRMDKNRVLWKNKILENDINFKIKLLTCYPNLSIYLSRVYLLFENIYGIC